MWEDYPLLALLPAAPGAQLLPQDMNLNPTAAKDSCLLYCSIIPLYPTWGKIRLGKVRLTDAFHISIPTELCSPNCIFLPTKKPNFTCGETFSPEDSNMSDDFGHLQQ